MIGRLRRLDREVNQQGSPRSKGFMLNVCTFRLLEGKVLCVWPFHPQDLTEFLKNEKAALSCYAAIKHSSWEDGFHPPAAKSIRGRPVGRGTIATFPVKDISANRQLSTIVDLRLFIPEKPVGKHVSALEKTFNAFDFSPALKLWGGVGIHVHDSSRAYFYCGSSLGMKQRFARILRGVNPFSGHASVSGLWANLNELPETECLAVAWSGWSLRFKAMDSDVQIYEKIEALLPTLIAAEENRHQAHLQQLHSRQ
jgi:hypothetical protein